ncbi:DegV family protein [Alteribacillus iranensis]|uniref:EDD domain protein, DegV family n=1 Tax=Alteribacillus iranensis TaxID=930128 RepID=A0A1I2AAJ8_9BACI|nr:DegV family protein [Alteribacillus iranensis]SFE39840.1 EDD domain protein, DegV family [Alteribacillus iranensis]
MTSNVKIVTDSTADIPSDLLKKYDISVVPLKVIMGNETFQDGVTLTSEEFYEKQESMDQLPTTSQPAPYEFETVYRRIVEKHKEENIKILSLHISSKLSGTLQSAALAAEQVEDEVHVEVVDSKRASYALGIIVVELAKMAQEGASAEACHERLTQLLNDTTVYFLVDTLEFLQKNGRIGRASALIGSLLKMKPVLGLTEEGEVCPVQKARGKKRALHIIKNALQEQYGDAPVHIGVSHAGSLNSGEEMLEEVSTYLNIQTTTLTDIGAVIGSHTGRGTLAVSVTKA